jgi:hypothetical protein
MIGAGQYRSIHSIAPLYLASEGEVVFKLGNTNLVRCLLTLTAAFYVFNMKYPNRGKNMYEFVEATLLNNTDNAKKRVTINMLLQNMNI